MNPPPNKSDRNERIHTPLQYYQIWAINDAHFSANSYQLYIKGRNNYLDYNKQTFMEYLLWGKTVLSNMFFPFKYFFYQVFWK